MPVLTCQSLGLCRKAKEIIKYTKEKSVSIVKTYGIFIVLSIEILSLILYKILGKNYSLFWYPFLTNLSILTMIYLLLCNRRFLKYCQRTVIGLKFLITYFIFNLFVITTGLVTEYYKDIVSVILLGCAFIALLLTIYQNKK